MSRVAKPRPARGRPLSLPGGGVALPFAWWAGGGTCGNRYHPSPDTFGFWSPARGQLGELRSAARPVPPPFRNTPAPIALTVQLLVMAHQPAGSGLAALRGVDDDGAVGPGRDLRLYAVPDGDDAAAVELMAGKTEPLPDGIRRLTFTGRLSAGSVAFQALLRWPKVIETPRVFWPIFTHA